MPFGTWEVPHIFEVASCKKVRLDGDSKSQRGLPSSGGIKFYLFEVPGLTVCPPKGLKWKWILKWPSIVKDVLQLQCSWTAGGDAHRTTASEGMRVLWPSTPLVSVHSKPVSTAAHLKIRFKNVDISTTHNSAKLETTINATMDRYIVDLSTME